MEAAKRLRDKISRNETTTGVLATDQLWPALVEYLQRAGLDYLIIDREHGAHADELVAQVCALGRLTDFPILLRPIDCSYSTIRRAIDLGPCGFLLPSIESAATLDQVRDSIYMPPRGQRRPGGPGNYWVRDFYYDTWKKEVEDDFVVVPQIETQRGLEQAEAIAAHPLTTAIGIGPYDLSVDLGVGFEMDHPKLAEAVGKIRRAGAKVGKAMWHIGDGPTLAAAGFRFICIGEPMGMLQAALAKNNQATKAAAQQ